jgi:hypothetical protein
MAAGAVVDHAAEQDDSGSEGSSSSRGTLQRPPTITTHRFP